MQRIGELRERRRRPVGLAAIGAVGVALALAAGLLGPASPGAAPTKMECKGKAATITENDRGKPIGNGNDSIFGTNRADVIVSLGGKDEISSGGGDDLICTGGGNDSVFSDSGDDRIYGGDGIDYLVAYTGDDRIYGGDGDDWAPVQNKKPGRNGRLVGATGDDKIFGGGGRDLLRGNSGDDEMYGEEGDDDLDGGGDTDLCSGGKDFDRGSECERLSGIDDPGWTPNGRIRR